MQSHFQTKFRFRNEFEANLTLKILVHLVEEHADSWLLTRREIEAMVGQSLDAPALRRAYFPLKTITLLETALDELSTLSLIVSQSEGRTRYPVFQSIQLDQVCERLMFHLNVAVLPRLTQWAGELAQVKNRR